MEEDKVKSDQISSIVGAFDFSGALQREMILFATNKKFVFSKSDTNLKNDQI